MAKDALRFSAASYLYWFNSIIMEDWEVGNKNILFNNNLIDQKGKEKKNLMFCIPPLDGSLPLERVFQSLEN